MLLMTEKHKRDGIRHAIHRYAKANNNYIKYYDKNKDPSYLKYWDVNNLYGWAVSQKLPVSHFKWVKRTFQFNRDFMKNLNEDIDEGYFFEVGVQYPEILYELHNELPSLLERMKIEKVGNVVLNLSDKKICQIHKEFKTSTKSWTSIEKSS